MTLDYSFEDKITDGKAAIIRNFAVDFNKITITFENIVTGLKKELHFQKVISLSMKADCGANYNNDMEIMAYRNLISFGVNKTKDIYTYVMKTDDYEFIIKSKSSVSLSIAK